MSSIQLQTDSILQVPLQSYNQDFTFIVNGERYQTNKVSADLLSTKISKMHQIDLTISEYSITTRAQGDFQFVLGLLKFNQENIPETQYPFLSEIIDHLGTEKVTVNIPTKEIKMENVIDLLLLHEKSRFFFKKNFLSEIDFLSEHFYEIQENQKEELFKLSKDTLEKVINNEKLSLQSEDQLLDVIDELYSRNEEFIDFYEFVYFKNVTNEQMKKFVYNIKFEYLTRNGWLSLSKRLILENDDDENIKKRYKITKFRDIPYSNNNLKGIFNYFRTQSNIKDEVEVTLSKYNHGDADKLLDIESTENFYCTQSEPNSWICFEFKKHKIIPSNYAIKSMAYGSNSHHLKSWVIEGSKDGINWIEIDKQTDCSDLNGSYFVRTFPISMKNEESFKFLRIRQIDKNWSSEYYLDINSMENNGKII